MANEKYNIPSNWENKCDGKWCGCGADSEAECGCSMVDWTSREEYELMAEVNALRAMLESEGYNI